MKIRSIVLMLFFIPALPGLSQKIDKQSLEIEYIQLPQKPLSKAIKNYSSEVILAYEPAIVAEKQKAQNEYEATKQNTQDKYNKAVADYPGKLKEAEERHKRKVEQYNAEMVEWNKKSTGTKVVEKKILHENNKPRNPGDFYPPAEPYLSETYLKEVKHQKIFNKEVFASTYLKLEGFKKSSDNALKITATLLGFESLDPELKSQEGNYYNSTTKVSSKVTKYWYEVPYRHPINLKIETSGGEILLDETLEQVGVYSISKTSVSTGSRPSFDRETHIKNLEGMVMETNMKYISEYLNSNYGYAKKKRKAIVYRVDSKKLNYDDYQQAFQSAVSGYNMLSSNQSNASEKINKAITIWEKALTESSPGDKKARINSDITVITLFNLTEAYVATSDFAKGEERLNKILGFKPSKKDKKLIEEYRVLLKEQKERWEANN